MSTCQQTSQIRLSREKEVVIEVLHKYKTLPCLWNRYHKDYKNNATRHRANLLLLEIYKKHDPNATLKTVVRKILNLRTNYKREYMKFQDSIRYAVNDSDVYKPTLFYYDALSFLHEPLKQNYAEEPLIVEHISCISSDEKDDDENEDAEIDNPTKKRKRASTECPESKNSSDSEQQEDTEPKLEEWQVIGRSIGHQINNLNRTQSAIAQKLIADTIYYAKFNLLTAKSSVSLGEPCTLINRY